MALPPQEGGDVELILVERQARFPGVGDARAVGLVLGGERSCAGLRGNEGRQLFARRSDEHRRGATAGAVTVTIGCGVGPGAGATRKVTGTCTCGVRSALMIGRRLCVAAVKKPVAMTVILTSSFMFSSITEPKMMLASSCAASWISVSASLTSCSVRSRPPVMLIRMPVAPSIETSSSSGLEIACCIALERARVARARGRCPSARGPCRS